MIRAILCKLILGIDPNQVQADLRNLDAGRRVTISRLNEAEARLHTLENSKNAVNGRFTGRAV